MVTDIGAVCKMVLTNDSCSTGLVGWLVGGWLVGWLVVGACSIDDLKSRTAMFFFDIKYLKLRLRMYITYLSMLLYDYIYMAQHLVVPPNGDGLYVYMDLYTIKQVCVYLCKYI